MRSVTEEYEIDLEHNVAADFGIFGLCLNRYKMDCEVASCNG